MIISEVVSYLTGSERLSIAQRPDKSQPAQGARRVLLALNETAPAENLIGHLRDIIMGPQLRLSEARFEELLDILAEQKDSSDLRLDSLELNLGGAIQTSSQMMELLQILDKTVTALSDKIDREVQALNEVQSQTLVKLRNEMDLGLQNVSDVLKKHVDGLNMRARGELRELSNSFDEHVAGEDKKREHEREHFSLTLEQRIAQWRAELEDERRQDMQEVANSMMDIGRRLTVLRQG